MGIRQHWRVVVFVSVLGCSLTLPGLAGWPVPDRIRDASVLILTAILVSAVAKRSSTAEDRGMMPLSFIVEFGALLLMGGNEALFVAAAGIITRWLVGSERARPRRTLLLNAATIMVATESAVLTYGALFGVPELLIWPWQALPIAAAVAVCCIVKSLSVEVIAPLLNGSAISRSWPPAVLHHYPHYFIGASLAVGLVEIVSRGAWELLPVAALPLYCAYRVHCAEVNRFEDEFRRREVIGSLTQGMAVIDGAGRLVLWNDALERITDCPRERALGRALASVVPSVSHSQLPRAIQDAVATRTAQMISEFGLPSSAGARVLDIKILPVAEGVTLLWHDVTDRTQADQALKRSDERLMLAAAGANDGLWEWDLRTQALYVSGRWKALIGLPESAAVVRPDDWLGRVHADDVVPLREAINAHLTGATEFFQHEQRIRHEDGTYRRFLCRGVAARGVRQRASRIAGSLTDASAPRSLRDEQLPGGGFRDPLTGLCNRAVFVERLGRRLAEIKGQTGVDSFAALYLDLDRFKIVNDSLGHMVGDELLSAVSRRLETCLRQEDALARLGGDEFAILLNTIGDPQQANAIAFRIQKALSDPFSIGGREVFTSASIGIAFGFCHYDNPDEIMRDADAAMYHAKSRGKARHELFDADMHARKHDRLGLENDLRHAIDNNDFEVHYQPIVSLTSRRCVGFESLIRWTRNGEAVSPAIFIPIAEELGLIEPLGTWVLRQACLTFANWQRQYPKFGIDYITVNVSSRQLMQQNFMLVVEQAVEAARLKPCDLRLEITETALMDNPDDAAKLLSELRDFGVKIYLDDFGTGYSSLSHLHRLPVDALKIDRSFVRSLVLTDRPAIVESILALARTLNTSVVAEGIESDDQACELERLGCTHAQGYLFSRPLPSRAVEQLLIADQPLGPKRIPQPDAIDADGYEDERYSTSAFKRQHRIAV
jgi:diguanylate cyclase (GGDEF)-like protein/PAS domain S-box-containing protein